MRGGNNRASRIISLNFEKARAAPNRRRSSMIRKLRNEVEKMSRVISARPSTRRRIIPEGRRSQRSNLIKVEDQHDDGHAVNGWLLLPFIIYNDMGDNGLLFYRFIIYTTASSRRRHGVGS